MAANPKVITVRGRLSFPTFTAKAAYDRSQKGNYPAADIASASPDFQVLLEQPMLDKFLAFVESDFLPHCVQSDKKDKLTQKEADSLLEQIKTGDYDGTFNTPLKLVHDKTLALAPESVVTLKAIGNKGVDIEQKAVVADESELLIPDPDQLTWPCIRPIGETVHSLYGGCYVAVTLNLYAYHNGKLPGFSAGASTVVFKADGDSFGGGVKVDEDEIFLDD